MQIEFYTTPRLPTVAIVRKGDEWFAVPNTMTVPAVAWSQRRRLLPQDVQHLDAMFAGSLYERMMRPEIAATMTPDEFRAAREALGLTQQGLADALGVSKRTITGIEGGDTVPRVYALAMQALTASAASG